MGIMTAAVAEQPAAKAPRLDAASANVVTVQLVSADGDKAGADTHHVMFCRGACWQL